MKTFDEEMIRRTMTLARRGQAWVAPNPMVGAVIVSDGEIVGEGYHRRFGGPHAEVHALKAAGEKARGATLYVNLEPCSHHGKTPPCVDAILEAGVKRVVASISDPNPKVDGTGFEKLRTGGIDVVTGVLEDDALDLNQQYLKKAATGWSWVTLKIAQSLDGRIAAITGHSQWISGKQSLRYAHLLRASHDAVLVGSGTVHADDPLLTVRHVPGRNPVRVVLDSSLAIPAECKLMHSPDEAATWVFGRTDAPAPEWEGNANVEIIRLDPDSKGRIPIKAMLRALAEKGVGSVMVEGGSAIWTSFLEAKVVDKLEVVIAPMIIGHGIDAIDDLEVLKVSDAIRLTPFRWRRIGEDLHVAARVSYADDENDGGVK
jgi:diaminohydroxyphosphoribosylaminopyrimidine deaminase/5-amino-6-(5-phosphoribosylamino)uracil reductase